MASHTDLMHWIVAALRRGRRRRAPEVDGIFDQQRGAQVWGGELSIT